MHGLIGNSFELCSETAPDLLCPIFEAEMNGIIGKLLQKLLHFKNVVDAITKLLEIVSLALLPILVNYLSSKIGPGRG